MSAEGAVLCRIGCMECRAFGAHSLLRSIPALRPGLATDGPSGLIADSKAITSQRKPTVSSGGNSQGSRSGLLSAGPPGWSYADCDMFCNGLFRPPGLGIEMEFGILGDSPRRPDHPG
jgi:hypothetical protein